MYPHDGSFDFYISSCIIKSNMRNTNKGEIEKKSNKTRESLGNSGKPNKMKNKSHTIILICASIILIGIISIIIIMSGKNPSIKESNSDISNTEDAESTVEVETVYVTPEGVEDAEADYQRHLEEQKASAETDDEVFDAEIRIINNKISNAEYDEAISRLDAISRDSLSVTQLFRLYNVYTRAFEGIGDTDRYNEYVSLRTEQRNFINGNEE